MEGGHELRLFKRLGEEQVRAGLGGLLFVRGEVFDGNDDNIGVAGCG